MYKIFKEFREFALQGNAMDMAVGLILGASFSNVVDSLVSDVLMPPLGFLMGGVDFSDFAIVLKQGHGNVPDVKLAYGVLVTNVINFLFISTAIFIFVKSINSFRRREAENNTSLCPECYMEIPVDATVCGHCTRNIE